MKKRFLLLCVIFVGFSALVFANTTNTISVKGKVYSSAAETPILGAKILVDGKEEAVTNLEGEFLIQEVESGKTLRVKKFNYVGISSIARGYDEVLTLELAPIWELESANQVYLDVGEDDWFEPFVRKLYENQVVASKEIGNFRANDNLTRAELAVMVTRASGFIPSKSRKSSFCDVKGNEWYADAVEFMHTQGWLSGYSSDACDDGIDFLPSAYVNRAEAVKMVLAVFEDMRLQIPMLPCEAMGYKDVSEEDWFYDFVDEASCRVLVKGYGDKTFRPANFINRAEISAILAKAIEIFE